MLYFNVEAVRRYGLHHGQMLDRYIELESGRIGFMVADIKTISSVTVQTVGGSCAVSIAPIVQELNIKCPLRLSVALADGGMIVCTPIPSSKSD